PAKDHQPQIGDHVEQIGPGQQNAAELFEEQPGDDRQQGHKNRAEHRSQHRAEPADDHHREVVDRDVDLELLVIGDAEVIAFEHAGDAGKKRRDRKGVKLVAEDVDADDFGGDVLVADRDKGAPDAAAHQVQRRYKRQHDKEHQEAIDLRLALQLHA